MPVRTSLTATGSGSLLPAAPASANRVVVTTTSPGARRCDNDVVGLVAAVAEFAGAVAEHAGAVAELTAAVVELAGAVTELAAAASPRAAPRSRTSACRTTGRS